MNTAYTPPALGKAAFSCPYCHAFAHQRWFKVGMAQDLIFETLEEWITHNKKALESRIKKYPSDKLELLEAFKEWEENQNEHFSSGKIALQWGDSPWRYKGLHFSELTTTWASQCFSCNAVALWLGNSLIHPRICTAPPASPDLPEDIRVDVEEARKVLNDSPRASAALLRLALEKLCNQLTGKPELKLDKKIGLLVKDGLPERTQQAMDAIRVISNNAVHPGQIDFNDNRETALALFSLVEIIVHNTWTKNKIVEKAYALLPESTKNAIARRDKTPS